MGIIIAGILIVLAGYLIQLVNLANANIVNLFDDFSGVMLRHAIGVGIMYTGVAITIIGVVLKLF